MTLLAILSVALLQSSQPTPQAIAHAEAFQSSWEQYQAPVFEPEDPSDLARLHAELRRLYDEDQFIRWRIIAIMSRDDLDPATRQDVIDLTRPVFDEVDGRNAVRAMAIVRDYGFSTIHQRNPDLASLIVSIIQHAELDEQRQILAEIEPLALSGAFNGQRYALMYDRVAEAEGRPQRYGSQDDCDNGQRIIYDLEAPDSVDARRDMLGMEPLADYWARSIELYGSDC